MPDVALAWYFCPHFNLAFLVTLRSPLSPTSLWQGRGMHTTNRLYLRFSMRFACSIGITAEFCNTLTAQFNGVKNNVLTY
jgi:hypothetical protein